MSFLDPLFFFFIGPVLAAIALAQGRARLICLILASYLFYAAAYPPYVLILFAGTVFDYWIGGRIDGATDERKRKLWMATSIVANIGVLAGFKYTGFVVESLNGVLSGTGAQLPVPAIAVPLGISFFTFQSLSYTIDIYRRVTRPARSILEFASFISFFPHLVAGPIIRAKDFLPQLDTLAPLKPEESWQGVGLIMVGYFKKCVVADNIAPLVDPVFANPGGFGGGAHWLATIFFAVQIYADFSGYTDIATGLSLLLGIRLRENFHWPYLSPSIRDFWRRWHMSLSYFLRDYLYFSLGGNRQGSARTSMNLLIVWFLGGLWHGAAWHFVIWGLYHGVLVSAGQLLYATKRCAAFWDCLPVAMRVTMTFLLVTIGWVFFRAASLSSALGMLIEMILPLSRRWFAGIEPFAGLPLVLLALALAAHVLTYRMFSHNPKETIFLNVPSVLRPALVAAVASIIIIFAGERRTFIYFEF